MQRIDVTLSKNEDTRKERRITDSLMRTDLFIQETVAGKEKPMQKKTFGRSNEALAGLFTTVAYQMGKGFKVKETNVYQ
tara:strand:- start:1452 stop:1688 length:237 start_codon:yes stop_codon:yes gene_type:complete